MGLCPLLHSSSGQHTWVSMHPSLLCTSGRPGTKDQQPGSWSCQPAGGETACRLVLARSLTDQQTPSSKVMKNFVPATRPAFFQVAPATQHMGKYLHVLAFTPLSLRNKRKMYTSLVMLLLYLDGTSLKLLKTSLN